jgi:hypothetical protein
MNAVIVMEELASATGNGQFAVFANQGATELLPDNGVSYMSV